MVGVKTIGNATMIVLDYSPVLAPDVWPGEEAYFGSWKLPYEIPPQELEEILGCKYIWFRHGHRDSTHRSDDGFADAAFVGVPAEGLKELLDCPKMRFSVSLC